MLRRSGLRADLLRRPGLRARLLRSRSDLLRSRPNLLLGSGLRQLVRLVLQEEVPWRPVRQPLQEAWLPCQEELLPTGLLDLLDLRWRLGCPRPGRGGRG